MKPCTHNRTEFLFRRDGVDYIRCLECDQVFEEEDLELAAASAFDDEEEDERVTVPAVRKRR